MEVAGLDFSVSWLHSVELEFLICFTKSGQLFNTGKLPSRRWMLPHSSKAVFWLHVSLSISVCSMWHCILLNVTVLFELPSPRTCLPRECFGFVWKSVYEILCFYSIPWKLQVCCTYCQQLSCKLRHTFTMRLQIKLFYLRPYQVWLCWWGEVVTFQL